MAKVRALLLAAGRGVRMGGTTPKTLLPIGEHGPLLKYIVGGLKKAGIVDLLVVTGHRADEMQTAAIEAWDGPGVSFIRNMRYASWGNFHSVRMGLDASPGMDVMVVNCDIVVQPEIYTRIIEKPGELVLAVQRKQRLDDEDMRVELDGDRVLSIGKKLSQGRSHGEYAGVSLLRGDGHKLYIEESSARQWRAETAGYYEDVYNHIIPLLEARSASVAAGEYAEVDTPEDVAAASEVIERHF
ncbi:MAG: NTP transferase domain-containing protein [Actinobacteria bacterium]|nr:NTP transferase domain-containing protein [Actinomycetota bacterium]